MGRRTKKNNLAKYMQLVKFRKAAAKIELNIISCVNVGGNTGTSPPPPSLLFPLSIIPLSNPTSNEEIPTTTTTNTTTNEPDESKESSWCTTTTTSTTGQCLICGSGSGRRSDGRGAPSQMLLVSQIPPSHSSSVAAALTQLLLLRDVRGTPCNEAEKPDIVTGLETSWYCRVCLEELKRIELLIDQFEKCNVALWAKRNTMIARITTRRANNPRDNHNDDDDDDENVEKEDQMLLLLRNKLIKKLQAVEGQIKTTKSNVNNKRKKNKKMPMPSSNANLKDRRHGKQIQATEAALADDGVGRKCLRKLSTKKESSLRSKILQTKVDGDASKLVAGGRGNKRKERLPRNQQILKKATTKPSAQFVLVGQEEEGEGDDQTSFLEEEEEQQEMEQTSFLSIKKNQDDDEEEEEWEIKDDVVDPLALESPTDNNDLFLCKSSEMSPVAIEADGGFEKETNSTAPSLPPSPSPQTNQITFPESESDFTFKVRSQMIKAYHKTNKIKLKPKSDPSRRLSTSTSAQIPKKEKKKKIKVKIQQATRTPVQKSGQCSECGQFFLNVKRHQLCSHGIIPPGPPRPCHPPPTVYVVCSVCGKRLSKKSLDYHMLRIHHEQVSSTKTRVWGKCNECEKFVSNLAEHQLRSHATTFTCTSCPASSNSTFTSPTFTNYIEYRHHLSSAHPELGLPSIQCPHCHKLYKSTPLLNKHIDWMHQLKFKFNCPICHKVFRSRQLCHDHVQAKHESIKAYTCQVCDVKFGTKGGFARHLRLHNTTAAVADGANGGEGMEQRKYKCVECNKGFTHSEKLKNHVDAIHGVNKEAYVCEVCGKGFPIRNYLYIHLRSHETPEEKQARRLKAKAAAEARKLSGKPVLIPKGRPRVRPIQQQNQKDKRRRQTDDVDLSFDTPPEPDQISTSIETSTTNPAVI